MSFVAMPPAGTAPLATPSPIINDGFFPDLDPLEIRQSADINTAVAADQLRAAIISGLLAVGRDLAGFVRAQRAVGINKLVDVPSPTVDGQSALVWRYVRAVGLYAKAGLIEGQRDFDTTGAGGQRLDDLTVTVFDLRRDALHLVRDILGQSRTVIALI